MEGEGGTELGKLRIELLSVLEGKVHFLAFVMSPDSLTYSDRQEMPLEEKKTKEHGTGNTK